MMDWMVQFLGVPKVSSNVGTLIGKVNSNSVPVTIKGWGTFLPETLLYRGSDIDIEYSQDARELYNVAMRFTFRPETWNKFPRETGDKTTWEPIYLSGSSTPYKAYELANFGTVV